MSALWTTRPPRVNPCPARLALLLASVAGAALLGGARPAALRADPPQLEPEVQRRVNIAIDKGVRYLRSTQYPTGTWADEKGAHRVGYAALPGLTLLECGVPASDPAVQRAAQFVRYNIDKLDRTYELALAILFLDRLADRKNKTDRLWIEALSLRLIAGQTPTGGWSYRCPVLDADQHRSLMAYLKMKNLTPAKTPAYWKSLPIFQNPADLVNEDPKDKSQEPQLGTTDNSNTQFAILALWAAGRHDIPVQRSLKLIARRFETSQNQDGSWDYHYRYGGSGQHRPAMNCVGLLGLAIGHGLAQPKPPAKVPPLPLQPREVAALVAVPRPLSLVPPLERTLRERIAAAQERARQKQDPRVVNGFAALDRYIGRPTGRLENLPRGNLYFLWSVERVAVLYSLPKLGTKDWYLWGAEILVANQDRDGHWQDGGYHGAAVPIDTCLALLFLKRANFTQDLASALPFHPESLTQQIVEKLPTEKQTTSPPILQEPVEKEKTPKQPPPAKKVEKTPVLSTAVSKDSAAGKPIRTDVPEKNLTWLWILIALLVAVVVLEVAMAIFQPDYFPFLVVRRKKKEEEDDRPRKRKKKRAQARPA